MSARSRASALSGVAAGLTATALLAAFINVPASAAQPDPTRPASKIKLPNGATASRVIEGRYLVETVATPLARGGSRIASRTSTDAAASAAKAVGATVGSTSSELWSGVSVTATDAQLKAIANSPSVKAIYPVLRVSLPETRQSATKVSSAVAQISAAGVSQSGLGIKVGVIDSGIDYNHTDLGGSGTDDQTVDFGPNAPRVKYGRDFVGDAYNPDKNPAVKPVSDAYPDDCQGHGTHVAGIIGADGSGDGPATTGIAPKVTFGAYRVFGCEGSTDTAVIIAALNKAKSDGMHIVNLSLGSDFDSWPSYPSAVAVANLAKAGVVVVVAAGNSGDTGLFSAGSPAVGAGVISVASYEAQTIRTRAIAVAGVKYPYLAVDGTATAPADNVSKLQLQIASSDLACTTLSPVPAGTALIIKGGTCAYRVKVQNAIQAGAAAAVIYNTTLDDYTARSKSTDPDLAIPAISIAGNQAATILAQLRSGPQPLTWLTTQQDLPNPDAGTISTFSSAGLAADLSLVPTISAPGAKIYSTLPIERGGHGNLSGTSMATPYVAGAAALVLEARRDLIGKGNTVAQLLYNTAGPVAKSTRSGLTTRPEAVFRQGSGVVNAAGAIGARVTASPSTLKLGDGTSQTFTISLTNRTKGTLTYKAARVSGVSAAASTSGGNSVGTTSPLYGFGEVGFKAYSKSVTIKAGKTAKLKVKLTAPSSVLKGKAGLLYGGWVKFTTTGSGNAISIPFAGLRGDHQSVRVLNKFKYNDGARLWTLPGLGYAGPDGYLRQETGSGRVFTMDYSSGDLPYLVYHLDYPASDIMVKITNTKTKKSYDAVLDWSTFGKKSRYSISSKSTHLGKQPRDADLQVIAYEAFYSKGEAWSISDGTYTLTLRALKPMGTASKKSHWETFTTKPFRIQDVNR